MKPGVRNDARRRGVRKPVARGRLGAASPPFLPGRRERAASPVLWENFPERGYLAT